MNSESSINDVISVKLDYIQKDIAVIKADIKDIKSDYISRREFGTQVSDTNDKNQVQFDNITEKVSLINRTLYWTIAFIISSVGYAILKTFIK